MGWPEPAWWGGAGGVAVRAVGGGGRGAEPVKPRKTDTPRVNIIRHHDNLGRALEEIPPVIGVPWGG